MNPNLTPIPATSAEPLSLLHGACFPEDPWDAAAVARILALSGGFGVCAWRDETPVGFVLARDLGGEFEILSLGVLPGWRRRGIACALLRAVFAESERRGGGSVVLEVACDNNAARRLYAALGFVAVGRRPRYYSRTAGPADALILRRMTTTESGAPGT